MDCADGEVARYQGQTSKFGIFLDQIMHMTSTPLMTISITYHFFILEEEIWFFIIGFSYICSDYAIKQLPLINLLLKSGKTENI